jgi:hypothetical protein
MLVANLVLGQWPASPFARPQGDHPAGAERFRAVQGQGSGGTIPRMWGLCRKCRIRNRAATPAGH